MSCACCDEIVKQLKEARLELEAKETELRAALSSRDYWRDEETVERQAKDRANRRISSLRGALTKAKRRIEEVKGEGQ